jgi:tRNA A-37 threonylcarbamoyl transferase component Bud32
MLRNVGNNYRYMSNHRINGETLEKLARANDLDESDLRAARAALAKLHACGAAMCDVHPRNFMRRNDGHIFIVDVDRAVVEPNADKLKALQDHDCQEFDEWPANMVRHGKVYL